MTTTCPVCAACLASAGSAESITLDLARLRFEARFVRATLAKTGGRRSQAAAALGLTRQGLAKLMTRPGICGPTSAPESVSHEKGGAEWRPQ